MENLKKNPLSLQLNVEDFAPASNDEKKSLVVMRESVNFWKDGMRRLSLSKNTPPKAFATAKAFGIIEENHLGRPPHGKARRRRPPQSNGY